MLLIEGLPTGITSSFYLVSSLCASEPCKPVKGKINPIENLLNPIENLLMYFLCSTHYGLTTITIIIEDFEFQMIEELELYELYNIIVQNFNFHQEQTEY